MCWHKIPVKDQNSAEFKKVPLFYKTDMNKWNCQVIVKVQNA